MDLNPQIQVWGELIKSVFVLSVAVAVAVAVFLLVVYEEFSNPLKHHASSVNICFVLILILILISILILPLTKTADTNGLCPSQRREVKRSGFISMRVDSIPFHPKMMSSL